MRTALLLLVTAGSYSVLCLPDVPVAAQQQKFKDYTGPGDELQLWTSAGGTKRRSLQQPAAKPAPKKIKAKAKSRP